MPTEINGLPIHPLAVHAIVVLLPLAALGTLAIALRASWRRAYGPLVVLTALTATVLIPIATSSGETLAKLVGKPEAHAELGETLLWFAIPVLVLSAALVWLDRKPLARDSGPKILTAVSALAVVAAVACTVQVARVGDSGANATWGDVGGGG